MSLSASKLNLFRNCPRCFHLQETGKIMVPRGIFPSLPGGVDTAMKQGADRARPLGELSNGFRLFPDQAKMDKMRNWRTGLTCTIAGQKIIGALDDLVVNDEGAYAPWDNKSKGSEPDQAYGEKYCQAQVDVYGLLLERNGYRLAGVGFLNYVWPKEMTDGADGTVDLVMGSKVLTLTVDPARAEALIQRAADCLSGPAPDQATDCEQCRYVKARGGA